MIERKPAFYAVIPARVRYDKTLPPNAKLLYAEVTAMADATGYCWASNAYFADLFGLSIRAIRMLISKLEKGGYILVEVIRDEETNAVEQRRIYIDRPVILDTPSGKNFPDPSGKNLPDPQEKNFPKNNTRYNNPPIVPPEGDGAPVEKDKRKTKTTPPEVLGALLRYAGEDEDLSKALMGFAENREKLRKPMATEYTAEILLRSLDKLSGGDRAVKIALLEKATLKNWLTVYELKPDELPSPRPEPGSKQEDEWNVE